LKFQAEISKGLERVEAAARAEVTDLTKLALKMHETINAKEARIYTLQEELDVLRKEKDMGGEATRRVTREVAERNAESVMEVRPAQEQQVAPATRATQNGPPPRLNTL